MTLAVIVAVGIAAAGCSSFKKKTPTLAYQERPVELLFALGASYLDRHQWADAVNYFREVERQHPYSEWSRRSILMTAYAHYQANNYAESIADSDRFIALYPGNAATPYAYYLKSVCYFEQIVDVGRDQASTQQAQLALGEIIKRYPKTEYATDAHLKLDMVQDQLAGKEMTIGRYYLRSGFSIAAIGRFRNVASRYQTTSHAPEALYRLVEAYLTVGLQEEARKNGAVLGYNYPGDIWYRDAFNLLTSRGLRPTATPTGNGPGLPRLPFVPHRKATPALAPPAMESAGESPAQADGVSKAIESPKAKPAKKTDLLHGVLGL